MNFHTHAYYDIYIYIYYGLMQIIDDKQPEEPMVKRKKGMQKTYPSAVKTTCSLNGTIRTNCRDLVKLEKESEKPPVTEHELIR